MEQRRQHRRRPANVAEIMAQIRRRIEQKKKDLGYGAELEDLAAMKLKPRPDPQQVRSLRTGKLYEDLGRPVSELLKPEPPAGPPAAMPDPFARPPLAFERPNVSAETLFYSSRGGAGRLLMLIRRLTRPLLKLFVNVDAYVFEQSQVNQTLCQQTVMVHDRILEQLVDLRDRDDHLRERLDRLNASVSTRLDGLTALVSRTVHYVQLLHGIQSSLVAELTKLAIENQHLKSRLEEVDDRLGLQGKREAIVEEQVQQIEELVAPKDDKE
ncbi:MAG: hypothetical protein AB1714_31160 [Acidobacteriota bacterium]